MVGTYRFPNSHIVQGLPMFSKTSLEGFEPYLGCSNGHSQRLSNFCGLQLQSQAGVQSVMLYLNFGHMHHVSSADLCGWNTRIPYTTSLKGLHLWSHSRAGAVVCDYLELEATEQSTTPVEEELLWLRIGGNIHCGSKNKNDYVV
nr:hypothetical protein [Tanacetum cinerariifolium]